jgi:UDP-2-acetamido-3-amino-2,3-dideoxy-glucuronate N-acetyltransferase
MGYFAHDTSIVDPGCEVGEGSRIWHFSHICAGSVIGKNCNLGQNVYVETGVILGNGVKVKNNVSLYTGVICEDNVFLGPSCVFTNVIEPRSFIERKHEFRQTIVREGASIGANATIVCGCTIGRYAFVGAGSVVTRDVPDYTLVYGVPASMRGYVCKCGEKLNFTANEAGCPECGKAYVLDGINSVTEVFREGI